MARRQKVEQITAAAPPGDSVVSAVLRKPRTIYVNEKPYGLVFDFNAQCTLEQLWGHEAYMEFLRGMSDRREWNVHYSRDIFWAMLKVAGAPQTLEEIGTLMSKTANFQTISSFVFERMAASRPDQKDDAGENPIAAAQ